MNQKQISLLLLCCLLSGSVWAQEKAKTSETSSALPPIKLEPERLRLPEVQVSPLMQMTPSALTTSGNEDEDEESDGEKGFLDGIIDDSVVHEEVSSKSFLGAGLSYSNNGVTRGMFTITDDAALKGRVSEKMFNIFLLLDLGWRESSAEALRVRWGLARSGVKIPDDVRAAYSAGVLEEQLTLMTLDFTLKNPIDSEDKDYFLWWGGGLNLHYAFSSQTSSTGGARESQLRHSSSISPVLSVGADINSDSAHQVFVQGDWLLWKAVQFSVGLRTRL